MLVVQAALWVVRWLGSQKKLSDKGTHMKHDMKKMAEGGGIREGKARFGDDIRERARKAIEGNLRMAERTEREPPVKPKPKPVATAKKVSPPKAVKPKPIPKAVDRASDRLDREPPVKKKPSQFGPATTFPRDVGTDAAAKARKESFDRPGPLGDFINLFRGKKNGGAVKKMANGGSVSKRADGIAQRGKTKGRII